MNHPPEIKYVYYAWEEYLSDMYDKVIPFLRPLAKEYNGIWAPAIGGYVPMVMLAHALDLLSLMSPRKKKTLIVDDIADSGKSLCHYAGYPIVTLFHYDKSIITPMLSVRKKHYDNEWIVFPWEKGARRP